MTTISNNSAKFFLFNGFGNYSESHNWDNGISMTFDKETSLEDVEQMQFDEYGYYFNIPALGNMVETFSNSYGGSRNTVLLVCANNFEEAQELCQIYEQSFEVVEYNEEEVIDNGYDLCQDPDGKCFVFDSGSSYMGTRYSYLGYYSDCEEAHKVCDERNKQRAEAYERWNYIKPLTGLFLFYTTLKHKVLLKTFIKIPQYTIFTNIMFKVSNL